MAENMKLKAEEEEGVGVMVELGFKFKVNLILHCGAKQMLKLLNNKNLVICSIII